MSKEIDNIKLEASIEKAIDAMEPSTDITDEQLQEMLLDKESRQAAQDILDTQFFLHIGKKDMQLNVEAELACFKKDIKNKIYILSGKQVSVLPLPLLFASEFITTSVISRRQQTQRPLLYSLPTTHLNK